MVRSGHGAKQLQRVGADAGDELRLERPDEAQPFARGQAGRVAARLVEVAPVLDQLGAEGSHRRVLVAGIAVRNDDHAAQAVAARGVREALSMVASRRADDAGGALAALGHRAEQVESAANLEGAGRRVVLVLDPDLAAGATREQRPRVLRRRGHRRVDAPGRGFEVVERRHRGHGRRPPACARVHCAVSART